MIGLRKILDRDYIFVSIMFILVAEKKRENLLCHSVHRSLWAQGLMASQTLLALATRVVLITPTDNVAFLEALYFRADLLDFSNTLMTEYLIGMFVVLLYHNY